MIDSSSSCNETDSVAKHVLLPQTAHGTTNTGTWKYSLSREWTHALTLPHGAVSTLLLTSDATYDCRWLRQIRSQYDQQFRVVQEFAPLTKSHSIIHVRTVHWWTVGLTASAAEHVEVPVGNKNNNKNSQTPISTSFAAATKAIKFSDDRASCRGVFRGAVPPTSPLQDKKMPWIFRWKRVHSVN